MRIVERHESAVRSYCRSFPTVFKHAAGTRMTDEAGREYLDFFAGAGALNYGHNPPQLKRALIEYLEQDGVTHSLDMATTARERFLETLHEVVLAPRKLDYKVQFPGPTGTNAVEATLKLARKVTGRTNALFFTNGFHGMTLGSLAVTGNAGKRAGAGVSLGDATPAPYDGYLGEGVNTLEVIERLLEDASSGVDAPAAAIVETVQAEGGVNVADLEWLEGLAVLLRRHGVLLIVDDIQVGCGRTGPFFSFEQAAVEPDMICLSKSLSGYGLPLSIVLLRPELDIWEPGEHNGTFRGHNPALVTATTALDLFWRDDALTRAVDERAERMRERLGAMAQDAASLQLEWRGRGLIQGLACGVPGAAGRVSRAAFERGLIVETAGADDQVIKLLPPLTLTAEELEDGLDVLEESLREVAGRAEVVDVRRAAPAVPVHSPQRG
jgi:diaminobutyrate-2-oxoglutarate transaminase